MTAMPNSQPLGSEPGPSLLALPSSPATMKRKRSSSPDTVASAAALTPPLSVEEEPSSTCLLAHAVHVLSTAATALSQVTFLYQTDPIAREGLLQAVECIQAVTDAGGKLIVCGVGKSGLVGRKTVATLKSLGIACSFLHPVEALHGDLGDVRENDAILLISYSGKTPELVSLLSHIPATTPILAVTSQTRKSDCPLFQHRPIPSTSILLPAPIHEKEENSFGVSAPTTSTTVTIAVGDMLALTLAEALYGEKEKTKEVFRRNHPGGVIGAMERGRRGVGRAKDGDGCEAAGGDDLRNSEEEPEGGDRAKRRKSGLVSPTCSD